MSDDDAEARDVDTLLAVFTEDDDVRRLRGLVRGGSRVARRTLERLTRMGGERARLASEALRDIDAECVPVRVDAQIEVR